MQKVEQRFDNLLTKDEIKYFVDDYYANMNALNSTISTVKNDVNTHIATIYSNQQSVFQRLEALSSSISSSDMKQELKHELRHELLEEMNSFRREIHSSVNSQIEVVQQAAKPPESIFERLDQLNKRLDEMQSNIGSIEQSRPAPRQNLKEKIFKKVTRHSKEYVKSMLISLIKKYNKISGLNLREIVVEEQGIVSKSSFYRLLAEIEEDEGIHVAHEGKEKHYFWLVNQSPQAQ